MALVVFCSQLIGRNCQHDPIQGRGPGSSFFPVGTGDMDGCHYAGGQSMLAYKWWHTSVGVQGLGWAACDFLVSSLVSSRSHRPLFTSFKQPSRLNPLVVSMMQHMKLFSHLNCRIADLRTGWGLEAPSLNPQRHL